MRSKFTFYMTLFCLGVFSIVTSAQTKPIIHTFTFAETSYINKVSDNGLWAVANGADENNNTLDNYAYLLDVTNGTSYSLLTETEKLSSPDCSAHDVTDDGKTVVGSYQGLPAVCKINDDFTYTWENLPMPEGFEEARGHAIAVTPDGSIIVGTINNNADVLLYEEHPIMWKNGEVVELPNMPKAIEGSTGEEFELNRLLDLSADGNTLLGCLMYIYPEDTKHYVYHVDSQSYEIVRGDDYTSTGSTTNSAVLSTTGEWVGGTSLLITPVEGSEHPDQRYIPFKYNVKTKEFTDYRSGELDDMTANVVFNNGLLNLCTPVLNPYRSQSFLIGDYYYDLDLILNERYGIDYVAATGFDNTGTPISVSADGRTLATLAVNEGNHIITFPESIEEAAKGVNLLSKSYVSPVTGSLFSDFRSITVTFDKVPTVVSGTTATLTEYGSSEVLRSSISIAPTSESDNCNSFYVNFRPYTLADGVTYTVTIPAGTFRLGESDNYNNEIKVHYIGRKNEPVHVVAVNLEDGMEVTSLSYNSPVTMQFDTQLGLVDGATGALYQEGVETPVSDLTLAISSNMLAAYPTAKRNLYKGVNYIVKIPAGSVTDIMGNCGNEEISYTYVGAYVPEPPADTLLFADDFSDPSASYNNFMRYEGDHLTPNSVASGWTFDADNSPWIFSIRESENTEDYCAASISMYTTSGQSDDWMVTTQVYLPNAFCYLDFDVQSYLSSKEDRLAIYVYEDDAIYTQMSEETINAIKEKGTCIYNEVVDCGATEEGLAGEWTHHRIPLADFAEKNIYIAFVNQNTDQSAIFVDNVEIVYKSSCLLALHTKTTLVAENETVVSGMVKVIDEAKTYDSIKLFFHDEEETVSDTITATGLELKNGSTYEFTFDKKLPLKIGRENRLTIGVVLGEDTKTTDFTIKNLAFQTTKKVVIEEVTGTWCTNCPDGIVAIEHIVESFPGKIIPISIHYDDVYGFNDYATALGLTALPTARINRIDTIASPIYLDVNTLTYSFVSANGNETFMDYVLREFETDAEADVKLTSATYDKALNRMDFKADVTYALDKAGVSANILMVLLEDDLMGTQENGRAKLSNEIYGDWGKNGIYGGMSKVQYSYQDVARAIIGTTENGTSGFIPTTVTSGKENKVELAYELPTTVSDMRNTKVVCMLIDANNGRVINADLMDLMDANPERICTPQTTTDLNVNGGTGAVTITTDTPVTVTLYRPDGSLIAHADIAETATLSTGTYRGIVLVRTLCGQHTMVNKVIVK